MERMIDRLAKRLAAAERFQRLRQARGSPSRDDDRGFHDWIWFEHRSGSEPW